MLEILPWIRDIKKPEKLFYILEWDTALLYGLRKFAKCYFFVHTFS